MQLISSEIIKSYEDYKRIKSLNIIFVSRMNTQRESEREWEWEWEWNENVQNDVLKFSWWTAYTLHIQIILHERKREIQKQKH